MIAPRHLIVLASMAIVDLALGLAALRFLPTRVPMHWNWQGHVDGYGPAWTAALILPGCLLAAAAILALLSWLLPRAGNPASRPAIYGRIAIVIFLAFITLHAALLRAAQGHAIDFPTVVMLIEGALFAVLGNWLGKLRRNAFAGIRTPWTLASDVVWERTHRVGGRLMVGYGLVVMLFALLAPTWAGITVLLGGLLAGLVWACIYSRQQFIRLQKPA
ncbi:MAG TPA: SdpI family protein [Pirellulales bacterium]